MTDIAGASRRAELGREASRGGQLHSAQFGWRVQHLAINPVPLKTTKVFRFPILLELAVPVIIHAAFTQIAAECSVSTSLGRYDGKTLQTQNKRA